MTRPPIDPAIQARRAADTALVEPAIPRLALSVRQPWAYCLAAGWKPVENRSWRRPNPGLIFRGPLAIHASMGMTREEYEDCADLCNALGRTLPPPAELLRGGIVAVGAVTDIVREHHSPWFFGPLALVIADAKPIDFIAVGGQLGFFDWRKRLPHCKSDAPVPPAKWMLPDAPKVQRVATKSAPADSPQGRLL